MSETTDRLAARVAATATTNVTRPWGKVHRDFKIVIDGKRWVLVNEGGLGTCLVPWEGPTS